MLAISILTPVFMLVITSATARAAVDCSNPNYVDTAACGRHENTLPIQLINNYRGESTSYIQKVQSDPYMPGAQKTQFLQAVQQERAGRAEASCSGPTANQGARVQVVYLRKPSQPALNSERTVYLQDVATASSTIMDYSAAKTGGSIKVRWVRESDCKISVKEIVAAQNANLSTFAGAQKAMEDAGRSSGDRKYMVFLNSNHTSWNAAASTGACGYGTIYRGIMFSDGPAQNNINNTRTGYGFIWYGNNRSCWIAPIALHELVHNLGAIQDTAPNSTGAGHCTDGYDLMCYNDGGPKGNLYRNTACSSVGNMYVMDCGNNDYFHSNPAGRNTYLSTRWNVANSRFVTKRLLP